MSRPSYLKDPTIAAARRLCKHCKVANAIACLVLLEEDADEAHRRGLRALASSSPPTAGCVAARVPPLWPCVLLAAFRMPEVDDENSDTRHTVLAARMCRLSWTGGAVTSARERKLLNDTACLSGALHRLQPAGVVVWHMHNDGLHRILLQHALAQNSTRLDAWSVLALLVADAGAVRSIAPTEAMLQPLYKIFAASAKNTTRATSGTLTYLDPRVIPGVVADLVAGNAALRAGLAGLGSVDHLADEGGAGRLDRARAVVGFLAADADPAVLDVVMRAVEHCAADATLSGQEELKHAMAAGIARVTGGDANDDATRAVAVRGVAALLWILEPRWLPHRFSPPTDGYVLACDALQDMADCVVRCNTRVSLQAARDGVWGVLAYVAGMCRDNVAAAMDFFHVCRTVAQIASTDTWTTHILPADVSLPSTVCVLAAAQNVAGDDGERVRRHGSECAVAVLEHYGPEQMAAVRNDDVGYMNIVNACASLLCAEKASTMPDLDRLLRGFAQLDKSSGQGGGTRAAVPAILSAVLELLEKGARRQVPAATVDRAVRRVRAARSGSDPAAATTRATITVGRPRATTSAGVASPPGVPPVVATATTPVPSSGGVRQYPSAVERARVGRLARVATDADRVRGRPMRVPPLASAPPLPGRSERQGARTRHVAPSYTLRGQPLRTAVPPSSS